jgi:hypothetical protein
VRTWGTAGISTVGRSVPFVAEIEKGLMGAAVYASANSATAALAPHLVRASVAFPAAIGAGVIGAGAGLAARSAASAAGASPESAQTIGFGAAIATGAALGTFIPVVGNLAGALIGAAVAGGMYLWATW